MFFLNIFLKIFIFFFAFPLSLALNHVSFTKLSKIICLMMIFFVLTETLWIGRCRCAFRQVYCIVGGRGRFFAFRHSQSYNIWQRLSEKEAFTLSVSKGGHRMRIRLGPVFFLQPTNGRTTNETVSRRNFSFFQKKTVIFFAFCPLKQPKHCFFSRLRRALTPNRL